MKTQLSGIELKYLAEEFSKLENSRLDQVYQPDKNKLLLQFYVTSKGKFFMSMVLPGIVYLTDKKLESPDKPSGFCAFLRQKLSNSRVTGIKQLGSERILMISFERKAEKITKYSLYIEFFGKGNIILCDESDIILTVLFPVILKDRKLAMKEKYIYPKKEYNLFQLKKNELSEIIKKSDKENIVKMLAMDLGLSGLYAEELCTIAGIDKNKKEVSENEITALSESLSEILSRKLDPIIVDDPSKNMTEALPFKLDVYKDFAQKSAATFSEAIEFVIKNRKVEKKDTKKSQAIDKLNSIINSQLPKMEELEESIKEEHRKAELIYENYQEVKDLLDSIKVNGKIEWKMLKDKLKNNKLVKKIDEKEGKIMIGVQ